ncbi:CHAD domain-containing protein [Streptomyces sp. MI02-7b]|uniref:CHAD domain-containing protein n=1 Tax=Streptomyces sp. MI02-7b TaxID=462941 RepID=UPI0029A7703B|nr:CHAD domain-containing protein [Streptomyces sp. MI02-7b]MDX3076467.1 CHAD domain-containing protein [Streptomyces sp. MI02-7b]
MAQRHPDTAAETPAGLTAGGLPGRDAGTVLEQYLRDQATGFLRALAPREGEPGRPQDESAEAGRLMRRSARRIAGALHTYGSLTDPAWAEPLRAELGWLSGTLGREHQYAARLTRLITALQRLASAEEAAGTAAASQADDELWLPAAGGGDVPAADRPEAAEPLRTDRRIGAGTAETLREGPARTAEGTEALVGAARAATGRRTPAPSPAAAERGTGTGPLAVGAARAGALLERQLTLARTRAHSAALQAVGSSRFHAVVDAVALLASEVPLTPAAHEPAEAVLPPLAEKAHARLNEAAGHLALARARHPYNADALYAALATELVAERQDVPWNRVRVLLRLRRYAQEVFSYDEGDPTARLTAAARVLEQHREAAEAAAAVTAAARTPRIAPATAYALGVLHADQRLEVEAARYAFAHLWGR